VNKGMRKAENEVLQPQALLWLSILPGADAYTAPRIKRSRVPVRSSDLMSLKPPTGR
jgi:hypothetical protein